jgi:hypothetical protein
MPKAGIVDAPSSVLVDGNSRFLTQGFARVRNDRIWRRERFLFLLKSLSFRTGAKRR